MIKKKQKPRSRFSPGRAGIAMHQGVATVVVDYRPTEWERATEASYESAARAYCVLAGLNPEEIIELPDTKASKPTRMRLARWRKIVYELLPFDQRLMALLATQSDRITKPVVGDQG